MTDRLNPAVRRRRDLPAALCHRSKSEKFYIHFIGKNLHLRLRKYLSFVLSAIKTILFQNTLKLA